MIKSKGLKLKQQQIEENNKMIRKKLQTSKEYEWLIDLMRKKQILLDETIEEIKNINSIEVLKTLKENYII
jgi:hypothetical protein